MDYAAIAKGLPWGRGVTLLRCDANGLMAAEKPDGTLSHPNRAGEESKSLLRAPYDADGQLYSVSGDGWTGSVYLLNRLDSATSGIVLLALLPETAQAALAAFEKKQVRKVYEALVFGLPPKGSPRWLDRLSIAKAEGGLRARAGGGIAAETTLLRTQPIAGSPLMARLTLMPVTGRTHQLRIQTAKRKCPIVGDRTYGDFAKNKIVAKSSGLKRLCLHCVETQVSYRLATGTFAFQARSACPF